MMDEKQIKNLEALAKAATGGKWMLAPHTGVLGTGVVSMPTGAIVALRCHTEPTAAFIAAASPENVLALIDYLSLWQGYAGFLHSCASSGEQPESFEEYLAELKKSNA